MSECNVTLALAKLMIAAAWADNLVSIEEINCLKDLLFRLPEMTAKDWDQLEIYLDMPVDKAERDRLALELQSCIKSRSDQERALAAIDSMANADGTLTPQELQTVAEIREILAGSGNGFSGIFGRFTGHSLQRRARSLEGAPNRERYMNDFVRNKIYYAVSRRLELDGSSLDIPDAELRKLSLAGGLMARVAYVDQQVQTAEFDSIAQAIRDHWHTSDVQSALVAEIAVSEIGKGMDYYRLTREFFESTTEEERVRFLDVLFAVAVSDGKASNFEVEEIRTIAIGLKLTHQQFIDAKLNMPPERRAN